MDEKLLSISETAKLMDVCENTLRDWDIEGKFKAQRTIGGHRRYSLEQVREYVEQHQPEHPQMSYTDSLKDILKKWEKTEYLEGLSDDEKNQLSPLLEHCKLLQEITTDPPLSTNQMLWLTREGWLRCRFRKMVCVQPMYGPASLVFWMNENRYEEAAIVAATKKYNFTVFVGAGFDDIKNIYADCIARELELHILENLPHCNVETVLDATALSNVKLSDSYDYLIGPEYAIEILRNRNSSLGVDLFGFSTILDSETFFPIAAGGRYAKSNLQPLQPPIFAPYILLVPGPTMVGSIASMMMRTGWFKR